MFKLLWVLAKSQVSLYKSRMVMALCSMVACVGLVVWMVGSFESLRGDFDRVAEQYMGIYDAHISPLSHDKDKFLDESLLNELSHDSSVLRIDAVHQSQINVVSEKKFLQGIIPVRDRIGVPPSNPVMVSNTISVCPFELDEGIWPDMRETKEFIGVLGKGSASYLDVNVGDSLVVFSDAGEFHIKIVGIVEQEEKTPDITMKNIGTGVGPTFAALFVPLTVGEKIAGKSLSPNLFNIKLTSSSYLSDFKKRWTEYLKKLKTPAGISDIAVLNNRLNSNRRVEGGRQQAFSTAGMVLLCCLFIIFTTLSMGVNERIRQLALMRALGLTRSQISWHIITESFLLSIPALILGLGFGYGLLAGLHVWMPDSYPNAPSYSGLSLWLSIGCALGGGLLASIVPAWRASHVPPMEALAESQLEDVGVKKSFPYVSFTLGILFLALSPLILFVPGFSIEVRKTLYTTVGYLGLFAGILCLAPGCILLVERLLTPIVARLFGLPSAFLGYQLTRHLTRSVGTVVSLSIGLGFFVAVQCWGYSMVVPFQPTKNLPDVLVAFIPTGIPDEYWSEIQQVKGVKSQEFMPLAVEQAKIDPKQKQSKQFSAVMEDNVVIMGVDLDKAFGGTSSLLTFNYVKGNQKEALAQLRKGHHIMISEGISLITGLSVGDTFTVVPPKHPDQRVSYTIAAVVDIPGWQWLTKTSGLRRQDGGKTAALLIGDFNEIRQDFELKNLQFYWMNVDPGTDIRTGDKTGGMLGGNAKSEKGLGPLKEKNQALISQQKVNFQGVSREKNQFHSLSQDKLTVHEKKGKQFSQRNRQKGENRDKPRRQGGMMGGTSGALEQSMQRIAEQHAGLVSDLNRAQGVVAQRPYAKVSALENMNRMIQGRADQIITMMCQLPLIGLVLTTLALVNTLMASVRLRSREFGMMRAVGVTRGGLFRLVMSESILMGLVTIVLSLAFGIVAAWGSINLTRYGQMFGGGGISPDLVVPWSHLAVGFGLTLGLCFLAALIPAIRLSRKEILNLLPKG